MITSGLRLLSRPRVCKVAKEHSHVGSWKPGGARGRRSRGLTAHGDKVVSASRHTRPMRFDPRARKVASTGLVALRTMFVLAPRATRPVCSGPVCHKASSLSPRVPHKAKTRRHAFAGD